MLVAFRPGDFVALVRTRAGCWLVLLLGASILLTLLSTAFSPHRELAWFGSNWRRYGTLEQIAVVLLAIALAAGSRDSEVRIWFLRATSAAGSIAAVYSVFQYFGLDPFFPAAAYHAGDGPFRIVRPPSTLGHSDYFGAFLFWPVFAGIALAATERSKIWKCVGWTSVALSSAGILLSGSRAPMLGLAAGLTCLLFITRPARRTIAVSVAVAVAAIAIFYASPAGERLRARVHWVREEPLGGARMLLWRDSFTMLTARPVRGVGPESFIAEFPRFQSIALARAYPDFYHESPHNFLLDTAIADGVLGVLVLLAICGLAVGVGYRSRTEDRFVAGALTSAVAAAAIAHQFTVFTVPGAVFFYAGVALLVTLRPSLSSAGRESIGRLLPFSIAFSAAAALLLMACQIGSSDHELAAIRSAMNRRDYKSAALLYEKLTAHSRFDGADLYFSRRWATAAADVPDALSKLYYSRLATTAAVRAVRDPEQQPNALYNLAGFAATRGDVRFTEISLRAAIAVAPNWFKPHWALSRLLDQTGRTSEARREAVRAVELDSGKNAEVSETARQLGASSRLR